MTLEMIIEDREARGIEFQSIEEIAEILEISQEEVESLLESHKA